jgi:ribonuclease HI
MAKYYAVVRGRRPGIYRDWCSCEAQVKRFPDSKFKGFPTIRLAMEWMVENNFVPRTGSPVSSTFARGVRIRYSVFFASEGLHPG